MGKQIILLAFASIGSSAVEFDCRFTLLSGISCPSRLTDELYGNQKLSMALDFMNTGSIVFLDYRSCPFGLSGCFKSRFVDGPDEYGEATSESEHWMEIGDLSFDSFKLDWILRGIPIDPRARAQFFRFRDVHGAIGAGPRSTLIKAIGALEVSEEETSSGYVIKSSSSRPVLRQRDSEDDTGFFFERISASAQGWELDREVDITFDNDFKVPARNRIDPGVHDIVLPRKILDKVILGPRVKTEDGHVWINDCIEGDAPIITISLSKHITIARRQFLAKKPSIDYWCDLRISISDDDHSTVVLGRPFIRSIGGLILDGRKQRLGFKAVSEPPKPPFLLPQTRIPIFELDKAAGYLFSAMNTWMDSERISKYDEAYVLLSEYPYMGDTWNDECWYFLDIRHIGLEEDDGVIQQTSQTPKVGGKGGVRVQWFPITRVFPAGNNAFSVERTRKYYRLCFDGSWAKDYDMPLRQRVSETSEDDECIICMDKFEKDQLEQLLRCRHRFHRDCVRSWIHSRRDNPNCPTCRSEIRKHKQ